MSFRNDEAQKAFAHGLTFGIRKAEATDYINDARQKLIEIGAIQVAQEKAAQRRATGEVLAHAQSIARKVGQADELLIRATQALSEDYGRARTEASTEDSQEDPF